jgi:gentisate 1,2-dioxygenase
MVNVGTTVDDLNAFLAEYHLVGAGLRRDGERRTGNTARHWKWEGIEAALLQSGQVVTVGPGAMAGMRTIAGVEGYNSHMWMDYQILMPGERTQAHRTMRSETRLVWQAPPGAVFVCENEAYPMERGDVVITPPWTFHDHFNEGTEPAIWIDAFDNGYNHGANIGERLPDNAPFQEITKPAGYTQSTLAHTRRMSDEQAFPLPSMRYPWTQTQAAIAAFREGEVEPDPFDGFHLMFASPVNEGPTLPTIAWHVQLLTAGQKTATHRHNSTTYYTVFEGEGSTVIEDERIDWRKGDLFAVPPWTWHRHENRFRGDTILFSVDDWPALSKLGFYRKEEAAAP